MQSQHIHFLTIPIFFILVSSLLGETSGERTWGEPCNPSASLHDDQSTHCDLSKRLSCDMRTQACVCHHGERDIYNKKADRCETLVGKFCSFQQQTQSDTFPTICVENAECDAATNFCVCKQGTSKNEDDTACIKEDGHDGENGASSNGLQHHFIYVSLSILTIGSRLWL